MGTCDSKGSKGQYLNSNQILNKSLTEIEIERKIKNDQNTLAENLDNLKINENIFENANFNYEDAISINSKKDKFKGQIKDGKLNGKGVLIFSNGAQYLGEWKDNKLNGEGTIYDNGTKIEGIFENNIFLNGKGNIIFKNGSHYEGELKNYQMDGKGKLDSGKGTIYEGSFKNNKKDEKEY